MRDEVITYLERYTETFELPVELNSEVKHLDAGRRGASASRSMGGRSPPTRSWSRPGRSRCRTCRGSPRSSPAMSFRRTPSATGADEVPAGTVIVVGGGNTGFQIAKELSGDAPGRPLGRIAPDAAAAARARARPLLVADEGAHPQQDGRVTPRSQAEHARHPDRLESTRDQPALRRRAQAASHRRRSPTCPLRGRQRARGRRCHLGDRVPPRLFLDQAPDLRRQTVACAIDAASRMSPVSTSWG